MVSEQARPSGRNANLPWKAHTSFFDRFVGGNCCQEETQATRMRRAPLSAITKAVQKVKGHMGRNLLFDCTEYADYQGNFAADFGAYNKGIGATAKPLATKSAFSTFFSRHKQPGWSPDSMESARCLLDSQRPDFVQNRLTAVFHLFAGSEVRTINDVFSLTGKLRRDFPTYAIGLKYGKADFDLFAREMRREILREQDPARKREMSMKFRIFLSVLADNCPEKVNYACRGCSE